MAIGISISMFIQIMEQVPVTGLSFLVMPDGSILTVPTAPGQALTLNVKAQ